MKKKYNLLSILSNKKTLSIICFLFFVNWSFSQATSALWPLNAAKKDTPTIVTGCIIPQPMVEGAEFIGNSFLNSSGFRCRPVSAAWCKIPTNNFNVDFIVKASGGLDIKLDTIALNTYNSSGTTNFFIAIYYQIDGSGTWTQVANSPQALTTVTTVVPTKFSALNVPIYNGHTYTFRLYIYNSDGTTRSNNISIQAINFKGICNAAASKPTTTTVLVTPNGKYECNATAKYDTTVIGGISYRSVIQNGFCWSASNINPTLANNIQSFPINMGVFNGVITGLAPATKYYVQSYIITSIDTVYGGVKTITTAPASVPVLQTLTPYNVTAYKAISGGYGSIGVSNSLDSGGFKITEKGIVYGTTPTVSVATSSKIIALGQGNNNYSNSLMNNLLPNTKYYVKSYAINQLGVGYGNLDSFTTKVSVPTITSSSTQLEFGKLVYTSSNTSLNYTLKAYNLPLGNDTITVRASSPYLLSLSASLGFIDSVLKIPVNALGTTITIPIYVQLPTSLYGNFNGQIIHTATGVLNANTDTVYIDGNIIQATNQISNWGTEFWAGFGSIERMSKTQSSLDLNYGLGISITASKQAATVVIDVPMFTSAQKASTGFPRMITIPADSTITIDSFPVGNLNDVYNLTGLPDTRLYYTGISNRGIHITSTNGVPITVLEHIFSNNNSSAASMLQPVSSWGSEYVVQSYGGKTNTGIPSSFFFIIPQEDNTVITFTPANDIVDSSAATVFVAGHLITNVKYSKGITYSLSLNKGQIFNAMSFVSGTGITAVGSDLSGTIIKSIDPKKKIAVFAGNSRCLIDTTTANPQVLQATTGSDNLFQQLFTTSLWGKKYLTTPTKTMEYNYYRIYIKDTATEVLVNGVLMGKDRLVSHSYYQLAGNKFYTIEGSLPISVMQYIVAGVIIASGSSATPSIGNNGTGDPEMIALTPIEQYTNSTSFSTPTFKTTTITTSGVYINIVIKSTGVASFSINNSALVDTGTSSYIIIPYGSSSLIPVANAFKVYPNNPDYSYARFKVTFPTTFKVYSDSVFTAIVYGVASGESYGFNGGYFYTIPEPSTVNLSGNIITSNYKKINRAGLTLSGDATTSTISDVLGIYNFSNLSTGSYKLRATKNNDISKTNGINATDALFVQRHILNSTKLNSAYKIIAADVNGDKIINATDVLRIKRLILGTDTTFTKGIGVNKVDRLWEFVDSAYVFPDTTNPFPFKDSISFTNLTSNKINQTFIGVKLGDVNDSWNAAVARSLGTKPVDFIYHVRSAQNVQPNTNNGADFKSDLIKIPITVKNFKDIVAMQYTLHFDNKSYQFVGIENNKLNIDFNEKHATTNGNISMLWTDKNAIERTLEDGTELFVLVLKQRGIGNLELGISDAITETAAWDKDYNQHNIVLTKQEKLVSTSEQWSVSPNPTNGEIKLDILCKVSKLVRLELSNVDGKKVFEQSVAFVSGANSFTINLKKKMNLPAGYYYLKVGGLEGEDVKKILIK